MEAAALAFILAGEPTIAEPARARYFYRHKRKAPPRPPEPPEATRAAVDEPPIRIVRVIPLTRLMTFDQVWTSRIDEATDARVRAAVRDAVSEWAAKQGVPK